MFEDEHINTKSQILRLGYDYWSSLAVDGKPPEYKLFSPMSVGNILPHVILLQVAHDPLDFQYRIIGDDVLRNLNEDYTGQWLSAIPHKASPSTLFTNFVKCVEQRAPVWSVTPYVGPHKDFLVNTELVLPFVDGGDDVAKLLVVLDFQPIEAEVYGS